jgi:RES domain-containing protein
MLNTPAEFLARSRKTIPKLTHNRFSLAKRINPHSRVPVVYAPIPTANGIRAIFSQNEEILVPWSGVIFRSVSPRYARPSDILSGQGAYQAGGRWNAPGIYAVYGSLEPGLAADESFNFLLQHFGWQSRDVPPRMLAGIRASLRAVLDLTSLTDVRLPLDLEELLSEDWRKTNGGRKESRSQALGRAVTDLAEGILTPLSHSKRKKPGNLSRKPNAGEQD